MLSARYGCHMNLTPDVGCHSNDTAAIPPAVPRRMAYNPTEVGELLGGASKRTIYRRIADGEIPSFLMAGKRMVAHDDLVAYVRSQRAAEAK